ncbi:MAG: B-box zinc finger protein [Planctomycetota bacterium]|jgi:hypothetical protein
MAAVAAKRRRKKGAYKGPACPRCMRPLGPRGAEPGIAVCLYCHKPFEAAPFTPPERHIRVEQVAESGPDGAVSCAKHEKNAAVANCERCGAFMCDLCRIDADDKTYCPSCFERMSAEGALESTRTTFKDYSRMADTLSVVCIFLWIFGFVLGPSAIYYSIKGVKQKRTMGEGGGVVSVVVALLLGGGAAIGSTFFWLGIMGAFG